MFNRVLDFLKAIGLIILTILVLVYGYKFFIWYNSVENPLQLILILILKSIAILLIIIGVLALLLRIIINYIQWIAYKFAYRSESLPTLSDNTSENIVQEEEINFNHDRVGSDFNFNSYSEFVEKYPDLAKIKDDDGSLSYSESYIDSIIEFKKTNKIRLKKSENNENIVRMKNDI
jgi:hypothetical protein